MNQEGTVRSEHLRDQYRIHRSGEGWGGWRRYLFKCCSSNSRRVLKSPIRPHPEPLLTTHRALHLGWGVAFFRRRRTGADSCPLGVQNGDGPRPFHPKRSVTASEGGAKSKAD